MYFFAKWVSIFGNDFWHNKMFKKALYLSPSLYVLSLLWLVHSLLFHSFFPIVSFLLYVILLSHSISTCSLSFSFPYSFWFFLSQCSPSLIHSHLLVYLVSQLFLFNISPFLTSSVILSLSPTHALILWLNPNRTSLSLSFSLSITHTRTFCGSILFFHFNFLRFLSLSLSHPLLNSPNNRFLNHVLGLEKSPVYTFIKLAATTEAEAAMATKKQIKTVDWTWAMSRYFLTMYDLVTVSLNPNVS